VVEVIEHGSRKFTSALGHRPSSNALAMPAPPGVHRSEATVWQKLKMGALMGAGVGLTIGFIFGSYNILRGGAGPRGLLPTLSQYMLTSAATFSFFLAIGSVIRTDGPDLVPAFEAAHLQFLQTPLAAQRREAGAILRARWAVERQKPREA